jgi:hypothetical protein
VFLLWLNHATGFVRGNTWKPTNHTQSNNQDTHTSH